VTSSARISGKTFTVTCADAMSPQAEWLLGLLRKIETERGFGFLNDGVRLQIGWSILVVKRKGGEYLVCEPNYAGDPFHQIQDDLTCTLSVQSEQNTLLKRLGLEGAPLTFQDKVILAKGCLKEKRLYLERKSPSPGDSGWYIGPADEPKDPVQYEAVFVYQFLRLRPALLSALALPVGFLVVFDGNEIEAIMNDQNEQLDF
jgi:hypothetical protein